MRYTVATPIPNSAAIVSRVWPAFASRVGRLGARGRQVGQIATRKVDGWQTLAEQPTAQCIDVAA
jgi:hypothetical protein